MRAAMLRLRSSPVARHRCGVGLDRREPEDTRERRFLRLISLGAPTFPAGFDPTASPPPDRPDRSAPRRIPGQRFSEGGSCLHFFGNRRLHWPYRTILNDPIKLRRFLDCGRSSIGLLRVSRTIGPRMPG